MVSEEKHFSEKHGPDATINSAIKDEILKRVKAKELPCAVAFAIAKDLGVSAGEVGKTVDLMDMKLSKCQMGLFGYKPEKKIVKPLNDFSQEINDAIDTALVDGCLPCKKAWDIASKLKVSKMTISSTCEAREIKIKSCQLGAF
jgi:hypothetical protein